MMNKRERQTIDTQEMGSRLENMIGIQEELIRKAYCFCMKAHKSSDKPFLVEKVNKYMVYIFPGSWSVDDWLNGKSFGETQINRASFPSLRSIGLDETAQANHAFILKFGTILVTLRHKVEKAVKEKKQVVFTGHSSGGAIATLATLWFLETYMKCNPQASPYPPLCLTFGSPLVGDRIFPHALNREKWSSYFIHFIMRYDIIPRIFLAPFSSAKQDLETLLQFFDPESMYYTNELNIKSKEAYLYVMKNASAVATHTTCNNMGCPNLILETWKAFVQLSPYRPFGTHVFCTESGRMVVVKNSEAVLQILFYSLQSSSESEEEKVALKCFTEHLGYESNLKYSLELIKNKSDSLVELDNLENIPLSTNGAAYGEAAAINMALNDLGLSTKARSYLRAAGELQKQKAINEKKMDGNMSKIKEGHKKAEKYQQDNQISNIGYYDAFKLQKDNQDFQANVNRQELAGHWDELTEMLKRYELPDEFEGREEWIQLGTEYRRFVEPLDIANYYRHAKNEDTGAYMTKGRPTRYKFMQRWLEYAQRKEAGSWGESCVWARVEELWVKTSSGGLSDAVKSEVVKLEGDVYEWVRSGALSKDVFLELSTFVRWWKTLPIEHKSMSCVAEFIPK